MEDEAIIERLIEVRGIGRWPVEMLFIFPARPAERSVAALRVALQLMAAEGFPQMAEQPSNVPKVVPSS